jgi:hypothetical protein
MRCLGCMVLLLSTLLLAGCGNRRNPAPQRYKNILVLADLGSRLQLYNQPGRDRAIINAIFDQFEKAARQNLFVNSKDKLHIIALPNSQLAPALASLQNRLFIDMEVIPVKERAQYIKKNKAFFFQSLDSLYNGAQLSIQPAGSQVWSFFNGPLNSYLKTDTSFDNYVLVLSDGYCEAASETDITNGCTATSQLLPLVRQQRNWEVFLQSNGLKPVVLSTPRVHLFFAELQAGAAFENFPDELKLLQQVWSLWAAACRITGDIKTLPRITEGNVCSEISAFLSQVPVRRVQVAMTAPAAPVQAPSVENAVAGKTVVTNSPPAVKKMADPAAPTPAKPTSIKTNTPPAAGNHGYSIRQDF